MFIHLLLVPLPSPLRPFLMCTKDDMTQARLSFKQFCRTHTFQHLDPISKRASLPPSSSTPSSSPSTTPTFSSFSHSFENSEEVENMWSKLSALPLSASLTDMRVPDESFTVTASSFPPVVPSLFGMKEGGAYDSAWGVDSYFTNKWILTLLEDVPSPSFSLLCLTTRC